MSLQLSLWTQFKIWQLPSRNPCKPSVTLNWDPPANAVGYVTKYELDDNDSGYHGEEVVNGSTTFTVIKRESGLRPLSTFTFKVRAYSGDNASQEWKSVSTLVGMWLYQG